MSPHWGFPREGISGVRADRVRLRTWGSQGHEFTSNTWIDQSLNQKGNEAPTRIPPQAKDGNLGS